jgi:uncharacterized protein DUF6582
MATERQKEAARRNLVKARRAQSARAHGKSVPRQTRGLSTAQQNRMDDDEFAFPAARKEPLTDARHVRNAIARFDQVRDVSDAEREEAFRRIKRAAKKYGIAMTETRWQDLGKPSAGRKSSDKEKTKAQLMSEAKRRGITGRSQMTKAELVQALRK